MTLQSLFPHPIIQGPMAGGCNTSALVAAVSNAGALGSLAGSLLSPDAIRRQVAELRQLTDKPFMLNFFVQNPPKPSAEEVGRAVELLKPVWSSLGWSELALPFKWCEDFSAQFALLLELKPAVASFTFDILSAEQVRQLHDAGIVVIGTATRVDEALAWQNVGADAVIASGTEAGGHRGTFIGDQRDATLDAMALLRAVVAEVTIPVISAGNVMTGADIRERLNLGAAAVQMGTAFLVTDESGIHPAYKQRLLCAGSSPTRLTRAFSGRYARGLVNRFMQQMAEVEDQLPPYPVQNALTGPIRFEAAKRGDTEYMSLWCGTGVGRVRRTGAARLVNALIAEMARP
ncbi:NAD(P)H-dependent flavin oxidoreductase [Pseudoduganella umbonata]|uniref:Nitronate monooxygenase n=1 Tax=Pseudoduganella umbonata TaxID=864828 RepID=A0A4P8HVY7_9BURK|nr:nitronate monooxygenase [Pseudoduganella umbonata]MBB3222412.1 nitronate monooxygenase [Pseudoduganella umbonata]QCP12624.1 2-nitropropane dioxygenase [Pseudoduganella umbonata]